MRKGVGYVMLAPGQLGPSAPQEPTKAASSPHPPPDPPEDAHPWRLVLEGPQELAHVPHGRIHLVHALAITCNSVYRKAEE